jgi:hypothetical protein
MQIEVDYMGMLHLIKNIYAVTTAGICFSLSLLIILRIVLARNTLANLYQYVFFVFVTAALGISAFRPVLHFFNYNGALYSAVIPPLTAFFLSLYLLSLVKPCPVLTRNMVVIAVILALPPLLILPAINSWQFKLSLYIPNLAVHAYTLLNLFKHSKKEKTLSFSILFSVYTLWVLMVQYDHLSSLWPGLKCLNLALWSAPLLAVSMGYYGLDQAFLQNRKNLKEELRKLEEEYAAEAENIEDVVIFLARTVDAKDKYTEGHIERVAQYAVFLGERLGFERQRLDTLRIGALIHDIGKIGVDISILNKPESWMNMNWSK